MASILSSRNELMKLLDLAQCCITASSDQEEVDQVVALANNVIPFSSMVICLDNVATLGPQTSRKLLNYGYSGEWVELYFRKSFQFQDPVLKAAAQTAAAFSWSSVYAQAAQPSREFLGLAEEYVGSNGIACAVRGRTRSSSTLISMTLPAHERAEDYIDALGYLAPHLHEVFNRQGSLNRHSLMAPDISSREVEVLHWAKEGKSTWDIASILSISERTVKFHFSNIFRKLDVLNRTQAIAKAIHFGVIAA